MPEVPSTRRLRRRPREMKESILDVLLYLFEHYFAEDAAPPLPLGDDAALRDGPLVTELA